MSILIKGMEMPCCCDECRFLDEYGDYPCCIITDEQRGYNFKTREKRMDNCPLVPIPKHGRLIDAETLWAEINKICDRRDAGIISDLTCLQQILPAVRHAPTVIEAEEGE